MTIQNTESSWEQRLEVARNNTSARRVCRPGQSPSTAPILSSLHKLPADTAPPVVLYRDTNSWCPFCKRVWFALEVIQIKIFGIEVENDVYDCSPVHQSKASLCSSS